MNEIYSKLLREIETFYNTDFAQEIETLIISNGKFFHSKEAMLDAKKELEGKVLEPLKSVVKLKQNIFSMKEENIN